MKKATILYGIMILLATILIVDGTVNLLGVFIWHPVEWLGFLWIGVGGVLVVLGIAGAYRTRTAVCPTNPSIRKSDTECVE